MSGIIAVVSCVGVIGYLLWTDRGRAKGVSYGVWIAFLWIFFASSRYPGQWLAFGPPTGMSAEDYSEGSPLDGSVFMVLVVVGVVVLLERKARWDRLLNDNKWLIAFFGFALLSVLWSDEPLVSTKRWVKGVGNVVMALILVTERRPIAALGVTMRRLGYILLPLSVLFIRFFPELGRTYHMGQPMFTGVALSKNSLGQLCLLFAVYMLWEVVFYGKTSLAANRRLPKIAYAITLPMTVWLLVMADSATCNALAAFVVVGLLLAKMPQFRERPQRLIAYGASALVMTIALEVAFGIRDVAIRLLGRQPDLTTRTPIWEMLVEMAPRPWIGAGYEAFWTGERMVKIWGQLGDQAGGIIQAHNGYIETYLNLGLIGLTLLVLAILAGASRAIGSLRDSYEIGVLRILIIVVAVIYNYTEAAFKPVQGLFTLLLFSVLYLQPGLGASESRQMFRRRPQ